MDPSIDWLGDDQRLALKVREDDTVAFETVFRRHYAMLCDVAAVIVGSYDSAEEITADVFARIWEHRHAWDPVGGIRPYLIRAVRNRAFNFVRDASLRRARGESRATMDDIPGMGEAPPSPDETAEADNVSAVLWRTIGTLPPTTQLVLTLRWKHGMPWDEVANAVGSTSLAVQMQFMRAKKVLRKKLSRYFD